MKAPFWALSSFLLGVLHGEGIIGHLRKLKFDEEEGVVWDEGKISDCARCVGVI